MQHLENMEKYNSTFTTEVATDNERIEASVLEVMIARFPHVVTDIFKELDDETLTICRNISRTWCGHLDDQKFYHVRKIQRYIKNTKSSDQQWKKVLKNTPVEYVKELSVFTQKKFKRNFRFLFDNFANHVPAPQFSPLLIAAIEGNLELFKYVFEKTKNSKPNNTWTDLHLAAIVRHEEISKFLINNLEEKNPTDNDWTGMTLFHRAAKRGHTNVCKLIIENIDNKNPAAPNGCTPLHLAAQEGHLEIVRLIVKTGVNKNCRFDGDTPLDVASNFKSFEFYKLLRKDKHHFSDIMIFVHLILTCLLIYWVLFICFIWLMSVFMAFYYLNFCEYDEGKFTNSICHSKLANSMLLGILIIIVINFPLTIMIRVWLWFHKSLPFFMQ